MTAGPALRTPWSARPARPVRPVTGRRERWLPSAVVVALAAGVGLARVPYVGRPLSPDEAGFLVVGAQWSPGRSLYGAYWVDRPPLLIGFFDLAARWGGALPLRLLGIALAVAAVLLAARLGRLVAAVAGSRRTTSVLVAAATATVLLVTPLFGAGEVNGELIALPVVLLGLVLLLEAEVATPARRARRGWLLAAAGGVGAAAAMVKQNEVDVLLALVVLVVAGRADRRAGSVLRDLAAAAAGGALLGVVVLGWAATRGTGPLGLWDAVVVFRAHAAGVLGASPSAAATARLHRTLLALLVSGAWVFPVLLLAGWRALGRGPAARLRRPAVALVGWELVAVLAGGSYWLHYLVCLVPGTVLCVALLAQAPGATRAGLRLGLAWAAAVAVVGAAGHLQEPAPAPKDPATLHWLDEHARPGDTAMVAWGHADLQRATGMASPYEELWSLPVRVRDAHLADLARVLRGSDRPTWVVATSGDATDPLGGWNIDARSADAELAAHYRVVADLDGNLLLLDRTVRRRSR